VSQDEEIDKDFVHIVNPSKLWKKSKKDYSEEDNEWELGIKNSDVKKKKLFRIDEESKKKHTKFADEINSN
jgi:hypothetical protein